MPGYIRTNNHSEKPARIHDALSGDEFVSDIESNSPQEDQSLKKEIKAKLDSHPEIDPHHISIHAKGGIVSMTGEVESLDEKSTIEALVENIEGVSEVVNFLKVRKGIDTSDGHGINYGGHSL